MSRSKKKAKKNDKKKRRDIGSNEGWDRVHQGMKTFQRDSKETIRGQPSQRKRKKKKKGCGKK
jgi:hypothetical protein